jgi:hypothetical protein
MSQYLIQFETKPVADREKEFNEWYDGVHVPDVLSIPGFERCFRYKVLGDDAVPTYIASYEVSCEDPQRLLQDLGVASRSMSISPALDQGHLVVRILQRTSDGAAA